MNAVETLTELFVRSGSEWVLWLLFALFVASVAVALERVWVLRSKSGDVYTLVATIESHLASGAFDAAIACLSKTRSVGAAVATAGLRLAPRGPKAAEKAMESAIAFERKALEQRLIFLGTLGNNAPFVGLFGTVIGVILAFDALGQADPNAGAGSVASEQVMRAIAEALVATAVGIGVALPAVGLYNYFQQRVAVVIEDAQGLASLVIAYLVENEQPDGPGEEPGGMVPGEATNAGRAV